MGKPLGLTPFFKVVHPTRAEDALWEAIKTVQEENWSWNEFLSKCEITWIEVKEEDVRRAEREVEEERRSE